MDDSTLESLAELICGDDPATAPVYRSSQYLTRFFLSAGLPRFQHDGSTRKWWVHSCLQSCDAGELRQVVSRLASPKTYGGDRAKIQLALTTLNQVLAVEGLCVKLEGAKPYIQEIEIDFSESGAEDLQPQPCPNFSKLGLEPGIAVLLEARWREAERCLNGEAYLAGAIIMGSLLEGLLLGVINSRPRIANQSSSAPRCSVSGEVKKFHEWSLSQMIDVAHTESWIDLDVKRFSHSLRMFRNLIHPYQQMLEKSAPDGDTCRMCWLVVQAASTDLARTMAGGSS